MSGDASLPPGLPPTLARLLADPSATADDETWAEFVAAHTGILLHTCRTIARDHDAAMDGYAYVLALLREDGYRRLRGYVPDGRTRFTTWLVVVARRLLLDHHRHRYGRSTSDGERSRDGRVARRRLEDLVGTEVDPEQLATSAMDGPDSAMRGRQLTESLQQALLELAPADRLLISLRFEDGRPVREIASMIGVPTVFHVYRRLGAALAALKRSLARRGVEEPEP